MNILVVENDKEELLKLQKIFYMNMTNQKIIYVTSYEEALEIFEHNKIAVVVSELELPICSGIELFEMINMISPDTLKVGIDYNESFIRKLVYINKVNIFSFIVKPWTCTSDIVNPILKAAQTYEKTKNNKEKTQKIKLQNKKLKKYIEQVGAFVKNQERCYQKTVNMFKTFMEFNKDFVSDKDKENSNDFQVNVMEVLIDILYKDIGDFNYNIEKLMKKYTDKDNNRVLIIKNSGSLDNILKNRESIFFSIIYIVEYYSSLYNAYKLGFLIKEENNYIKLNARCECHNKDSGRYNIFDEKLVKYCLKPVSKDIAIASKENVVAVSITYQS